MQTTFLAFFELEKGGKSKNYENYKSFPFEYVQYEDIKVKTLFKEQNISGM